MTQHPTTQIVKQLRVVQYNVCPLAPAIVVDSDASLVQAFLAPYHQAYQTTELGLHSLTLALQNRCVELLGHFHALGTLHQLRDRGERGVSGVIVASKMRKRQQRHRFLEVGEELWVLSPSGSEFQGSKLQRFIDLVLSDELDEAEEEKVEQKRRVRVKNLNVSVIRRHTRIWFPLISGL